ncbi:MAG: sigma-54-dependent transcriptional regulator [Candidatus Eutrophobiaceae bacterium]
MSEAISSMRKLLLVEDEIVFARAVKKRLKRDSSLQVEIAGNLTEARRSLAIEAPDLVLLDMRLPDGSGLDLLEEIKQEQKTLFSVMVMSAYGELEDAVSAMKLGATDYLKKPIDLDELYLNVKKVLHSQENTRKLEYSSKRESHASTESKMVFLGDCAALAEIKKKAQRIAELTHNSGGKCPTVLVLGETGTGKDVFARMLHEISSRADRPFVHVDCASLPKELMEAELFGHEKGAFTDARQSRVGLIEAAEDGVLFLDEIGELSLEMQTKLLAVLERRTLRRIGSTRERCVNAWFIAATNRDLEALSARQQFRRDLYHRLNVLNISMPPLRSAW